MKILSIVLLFICSEQLFASYEKIVGLLNKAAKEYSDSKINDKSIFESLETAKKEVTSKLKEKKLELENYQKKFNGFFLKTTEDWQKLTAYKNEIKKLEENVKQLNDQYVTLYRQYKGYDKEISEINGIKKVPVSVLYKFDKAMQDIMDGITKGNLDSSFLLNNLDEFKTRNNMSEAALLALKMNSYKNLNNTVVGNYVNSQLKKAMGNFCSFNRSCAYNAVSEAPLAVQNMIESLLNHPIDSKIEINETNRNYQIKTQDSNQSTKPTDFKIIIEGK
ncbi:MAG: hypothetical protein H6622_04560 [Halobacteriovoraceae bacterium]|nr:hypothetical protein [Halobacteriovoraceae bacterium]